MARRRFALGAALAALTLVVVAAPASAREDDRGGKAATTGSTYIVRLVEAPVVAYEGGIAGLPATKPAKGKKIDPDSKAVRDYASHLDGRHDAVLAKVGGRKVYDYRYAFNGFAAQLSEEQAEILRRDDAVLSVDKTREMTIDTATTPAFLGLTD